MTEASSAGWVTDLGLEGLRPPVFFRSISELDAAPTCVPQAHAIRRALGDLAVDGVICLGGMPSVYIKRADEIDPSALRELHRRVWNQGLAPVLLIVTDSAVRVYSAYASPATSDDEMDLEHRLIDTLLAADRALEVKEILFGIETGQLFRVHSASFAPERRVDRSLLANLGAARSKLQAAAAGEDQVHIVDRLLCRLVFSCYLTDRRIIDEPYFSELGAPGASKLLHLFEPAPQSPRPVEKARQLLYKLFAQLKVDFNGDMFSADMDAEALSISDDQIMILHRFLRGDNMITGQLGLGFSIYDFGVIPVETISSIYEEFLKISTARAPAAVPPMLPSRTRRRANQRDGAARNGARPMSEKRSSGAYYTPRFLAEVVLDSAMDRPFWWENRYLDPACGSGIFLVGIFHRLAEEWRRRHPQVSYEKHVDALVRIVTEQLCGVDRNVTACRIAAFSLYVALLDQLSPCTIRQLQARGRWLPPLVALDPADACPDDARTILHRDFGVLRHDDPRDRFDVIVGNPPWVSRTGQGDDSEGEELEAATALISWCQKRKRPVPQGQIAYCFVWKAVAHLRSAGTVCFLLPYGVLFNHHEGALKAQHAWFLAHPPDRIVNLSDLRHMLFEGAKKPALIVRYGGREADPAWRIEYHVAKADMGVLYGCRLTLEPDDRSMIALEEVLEVLAQNRVPTVWKRRMWGTARDERLLGRLMSFSQLGDITDQAQDRKGTPQAKWKRWIIGEGFQPLGLHDDLKKSKDPWPEHTRFVEATDDNIDLVLLPSDCGETAHEFGRLRRRPEFEDIFKKPHVIITKFLRIAFADFDVVFRHAARGLHGPPEDTSLLVFLAAYLRSPLGKYLLFHTAASWGNERDEVHLSELLRLPFPLPEELPDTKRAYAILRDVTSKVLAARETSFFGRVERIAALQDEIRPLIEEYFGIDEHERALIDDTAKIAIPSATPRKTTLATIPALADASERCEPYETLLCDTLSNWARRGRWAFAADVQIASKAGLAIVGVWRVPRGQRLSSKTKAGRPASAELADALAKIQTHRFVHRGATALGLSLKLFIGDRLYIVKPLGGKYWSATAAMNDADEIARAILSPKPRVAGEADGRAAVQVRGM